ncbi:Fur family transcriptional regulator, zinc uptake regulator [Pseudooceanicola antarcticus]|uniref:Fur family transcriptional regulator n=1 Tax=Pseudooceanicola antarcticus TaxID=1247613 RepID=A0A285IE27_9RHOB|nr:transcriptional repressor [Pseudooceanicola antarcticus]PJE29191.1 Fur family transcriptional regulator [Pseudooceanicola antarcticus]SNY46234.1 Fur family transcriptional regulator, zinc uptake regulator [Pseudooceanicola antarcticus]
METTGFARHDHGACIRDGVTAVAEHCRAEGLQFTPVRRRVLELLLEGHRALGAYDILDRLREEGLGSQPPVAYRALDFLVKNGFAHKIERLNAFVACACPGESHMPAFLICRKCDKVAEAEADMREGKLAQSAAEAGFHIERAVVEAEGLCPNCSGAAA